MNNAATRMFARDVNAMLALSDARKAEDAERRARAQANPELCAALLAQAKQAGRDQIDWPEYFRNARMV
jgi:hypothetical protein